MLVWVESVRSSACFQATISLLVLCWHQCWSQHWFPDNMPCCGSGRNAKHIALTSRRVNPALPTSPSPPSRPPAPTTSKRNKVFSMASRSVTPCFLDLASCFVTNVFWKTPPEYLDLGPMTKDQRKHHSNHHRNLNRHHHHHRDHIINTMYSSTLRCWLPVAQG